MAMANRLAESFNTLRNYTPLKRVRRITCPLVGFNTLRNYTPLKPDILVTLVTLGFNTLRNYTPLKQWANCYW